MKSGPIIEARSVVGWSALVVAIAAALMAFDWFFVPPYGTLAVDRPLDWGLLFAFLVMGVLGTHLFRRAKREAAAAHRSSQREALVASVSHDLRTPLTTIKALAHDLAAAGDDRAELIETEVDRLNVLVGDLLDLSRLNAGSLPMSIEANEAEDLLGAALQQVTGVTRDRVVSVTLDPENPLLFGRFDFTHTLRVVVNLIENALKYSPREQPVDVIVKRDGPWLAFAVADRGPGVAAEERVRIFEPFYRPEGVPADAKGVGLGLSIARGLAEVQGGTLSYGERMGGGSVFTLRVPAIDVTDTTFTIS
jgi:two-component system sensor histidine kinase KdpD